METIAQSWRRIETWLHTFAPRRVALFGACPDVSERFLAHRLRGETCSPGPVLHECPALVAPNGLAVETAHLATARKRDPEAERKLAALEAAQRAAAVSQCHLLSLEESDLYLLPLIRAMWMKGQQVQVKAPGTN